MFSPCSRSQPDGRRAMIAPSGEQIEIAVGEVGGAPPSYPPGARKFVDGYRPDEMSPWGGGKLLTPWPNRLKVGRYECAGGSPQPPLNEPDPRNAIPGLVRWAPWTTAE